MQCFWKIRRGSYSRRRSCLLRLAAETAGKESGGDDPWGVWYPFIAIGKITLLQGDPGDGKSTMMMNLIAELSTGGKTPDGCKIGAPQKVIYQCSEDGVSDTIKPRLERCGADCKKIGQGHKE